MGGKDSKRVREEKLVRFCCYCSAWPSKVALSFLWRVPDLVDYKKDQAGWWGGGGE